MSFTRRPGSGRPRQTSRREDSHIVRNARIQPIASPAAIQAQDWCRARVNWTAAEWNQLVFSDKSRFNLSSDINRVRVWRPHGERINPAFALQRHTAPTAGVMVWGAIAYNTRSPLVVIRGNMTASYHMCCHSCNGSLEPFSIGQCSASHVKDVTRLSPHCYYPCLAFRIPRFVCNRSYLESFGMASWESHEFKQTRGKEIWKQIWKEMSQDIIQNLYASMPDRIASCICARVCSTGY
ncbi:transposable element Tcb1 transposase [Trichonephila clavipes]|uniref:Transposable element Tcb1 transposase n=1 Tax=Trichonephila clavipes TaxID=2585209 RepID=A0A8X6VDV9_TRICX|nr:transposable element Tcb1 transposase [Trichonephila clavipes]